MNRVVNLILLFIRTCLLIRLESNMFALKDSFRFDLIIPIDSLTVIPFSCSEKNVRRIWQQRLRAK